MVLYKELERDGDNINYKLYQSVIYDNIEEIKLRNPLAKSKEVYINIPNSGEKKYKFMIGYGYQWEDSSEIFQWY